MIFDPDDDARYYQARETNLIHTYRTLLRVCYDEMIRLGIDLGSYNDANFRQIKDEIHALQQEEKMALQRRKKAAESDLENARRRVLEAEENLRKLG